MKVKKIPHQAPGDNDGAGTNSNIAGESMLQWEEWLFHSGPSTLESHTPHLLIFLSRI